jgi:hypothetical protein
MTMTMERPETQLSPALRWRVPQAGVWVAHLDDRFVGLVNARWGTGFTATTHLGKDLGLFRTVDEAQMALERHVAHREPAISSADRAPTAA